MIYEIIQAMMILGDTIKSDYLRSDIGFGKYLHLQLNHHSLPLLFTSTPWIQPSHMKNLFPVGLQKLITQLRYWTIMYFMIQSQQICEVHRAEEPRRISCQESKI